MKVPRRFRWGKAKRCYWCGIRVSYDQRARGRPHQATREHVRPRSMGGTSQRGANLAAACYACNHARGDDTSWVPFHLKVSA